VPFPRLNAIRPFFRFPEGPRDTPEILLRDRHRSSMRPAVRLTRRPDGGFRIEGVGPTPIDGVPAAVGFAVTGAGPWGLTWSDEERGWLLTSVESDPSIEVGRTASHGLAPVLSPSSVLLADGRLFRLAMFGASDPRIELGRWDVPGAYIVGRAVAGDWELELTAAGTALTPPPELWILASVEIGRLDGWYRDR
jgi:hypothetical protein